MKIIAVSLLLISSYVRARWQVDVMLPVNGAKRGAAVHTMLFYVQVSRMGYNSFDDCVVFLNIPLPWSNVTAEAEMRSKNITEFFPEAKGNLTKITWAHAVNSLDLLKDALNGTVMMLEADIVLGKLNGSAETIPIPIMAHPPATVSDLSLHDFLQTVQDFNVKENNTARKGVKLDFKSIEVFDASVSIIKDLYPKMNYPVWLNADIFPGPLNTTDKPVDASKFTQSAKGFDNATLSIGWKTRYGGEISNASYTAEHVAEMADFIQQNNISQPITFPVRAGIAAQSLGQLKGLVNNVTDSTLTLWNGEGDHVDVEGLRKLIGEIGVGRVYIDLPDELKNKLRLHESGGSVLTPLSFVTVILTVLMRLL